jgi:signal transduction histidine kinase
MKTQTKLATIFFLVSLIIIIGFSGLVYYFIIQYSFTDFYKRLEIRAVVAAKSELEEEVAAFEEVRKQHLEKLPQEKEYFFEITSNNDFRAEARKLNLPISFFNNILKEGNTIHQQGEIFFSGIRYPSKKGDYIVIVSAENYYNSHHLAYLRNIFMAAIIVTSLLALYVSILFSKIVFNPVKRITSSVREISSQNLHLRLQPSSGNDEISELTVTFNNMLDRLETSFETQNNFISNASHELSNPLTSIIGAAEVTLSKERKPEEYIEALQTILMEAERLDNITRSLLLLAQTGFDGKKQKFERVRADQLLWDVKETVDKMNPRNKVHINLSLMPEAPEKLKIMGHPHLLILALSNLVNNACKYSNNQTVTMAIGTSDERVIIVIKDLGIGIPEEDIPHIYDPFFRASNTNSYEGYGIGLPLTRNIVRMHKGDIEVTSQLGKGTTVQLSFPNAPIITLN